MLLNTKNNQLRNRQNLDRLLLHFVAEQSQSVEPPLPSIQLSKLYIGALCVVELWPVEATKAWPQWQSPGSSPDWLIPGSGRTATRGLYKKAHPLFVDPPSDMSMSCTRRAEFESAAFRRLPDESSVFVAFRTPPPTDQKSSITISTSNTTTAHTQMDLPFVGVRDIKKHWKTPKAL